jgi:hypothetical protein
MSTAVAVAATSTGGRQMSTTTITSTEARVSDRPASVAASWTPLGRAAAATALTAGGLFWLIGDLIGFGHSGSARRAFELAHPTLAGMGVTADMLGTTLLMFAIPIWLLLARQRAPRLAWAGAVVSVFGMTAQAVMHGVDIVDYLVARDATGYAAVQHALDTASGLPFVVFFAMFFVGAFAGTAITMVALWRSRALPVPALLLWIAFLAVNLLDVPMPTTILAVAALTWMAVAIARPRARGLR